MRDDYDRWLREGDRQSTKINWAGMIWHTFWFVVLMCLIAAAVASTLDLVQ